VSSGLRLLAFEPLFVPGKRGRVGSQSVKHQRTEEARRVLGRIGRNVRGSPQVMVKVTSRAYSASKARAHADYIVRHGHLSAEDERGFELMDAKSVRESINSWRLAKDVMFLDRRADLPDHKRSRQRQTHHVVLGMPAGTDPLKLMEAARHFAQTEFSGHRYLLVLHEPTTDLPRRGKDGELHPPPDHPHVHVMVRSIGIEGRHLRVFKQDLRRWRESFAEQLRGVGIDANASKTDERGRVGKRARSDALRQRIGDSIKESPAADAARNAMRIERARHDYERVIDGYAWSPGDAAFVRALRQWVDQTFPRATAKTARSPSTPEISSPPIASPEASPSSTRLKDDERTR
jgi:type IV secretion system T-DNA border endonuclease VirD2